MTPTSVRTIPEQEDPLALLPATVPVRYKRNAVIYSEWEQAGHLYLIVRGRVKVTRGAGGRSVVIDVYGPNEFFGECGLLDAEQLPEQAVALEKTEATRWMKSEIEELVLCRPQLGMALIQTLVRRTIDFGTRLQDCIGEKTAGRVLRSLIRLADRSAAAADTGSVHVAPLTHQLLAEYTGTSRERVTQHMNEFRRQGLLNYSRNGIILTRRAFQVAERGRHGRARVKTVALDGSAA
jgi:CRP-like cAMP-binding protein